MNSQLEMFKKLTEAKGVAGNEKDVRNLMKEYINDYADDIYTDKLGSLICKKVGDENGPKIMISGHMDEIGFLVANINDNGFITFQTLGGWNGKVMLSQKVLITTSKGREYIGIINGKPSKDAKAAIDKENMFIDIGVDSKEEVEKLGIRQGDMITPYFEFSQMANTKYLLAKAWDDRVGCALCIDILKDLKNKAHKNIVYAVGTVQEEVGCRGAKTASNVVNPDIGFSLDVSVANDTPGSDTRLGDGKLGNGPQIHIFDGGLVGHVGLKNYLIDLAEELQIPYQINALPFGGTDASQMHVAHDGAPCISIGIPTRYIHSHASIIHKDDYDNTVRLLSEFIQKIDNDGYNKILNN
ncbi:M42 family metallopeptidase [Paraclostridium sordellii]|uniref:M42 family metallopeptidase n=1 Tax=Paraclostridium sordellii TaxID=1505 RepID=UPI0005E76C18|nr:M42 family metallopeptidase [Paeniclostridium sordellii]CEP80803.1 exoaminopeptidase [[Clostridium] sordellii] [Paeniclostridium sordellii]